MTDNKQPTPAPLKTWAELPPWGQGTWGDASTEPQPQPQPQYEPPSQEKN